MADCKHFTVMPSAKIHDAVATIEGNQKGIAIVVDDENHIIGTITDGDLRRAFLKHHELDESIMVLLKRDQESPHPTPLCGYVGMPNEELLSLLKKHSLRHLPILNDENRLVDVVFLNDLSLENSINVRAVVMAGGFGTRLQPLTESMPKPMLQIDDKPLMEHMIEQIRDSGIHNIHITTHYLPEKIHEHFGDGEDFGVDLNYVPEEEPLGTAGALSLLKVRKEPLLVVNGDILTKVNFTDMINYHRDNDASITIGVTAYEIEIPYGVIETDGNEIIGILEKPVYKHFVSAGMYVIEPEVLALMPQGERCDMPELIEMILKKGHKAISFPIREYWLDVGRHKDYDKAQTHISEEKMPS
jgi:dTDP-glucose pyrophosphorylase